jgi:hypothetical protein
MGKPTERELADALTEAARMREQGEDPHFLAKSLLNLNYRIHFLQRVLQTADTFLHYGQEAKLHTELLRAIEEAKRVEEEVPEPEGALPDGLI